MSRDARVGSPRGLVIGDSHSVAIAEGLATKRPDATDVRVCRLYDERRPSLPNTVTVEEAVRLAAEVPADGCVLLSKLGTYHNIIGLLRSGPAFDFLLNPGDTPDPEAEVRIPQRAIESAFERHLTKASFIGKVRDSAKARVFILSTPPPKQSNAFLLERFMEQQNKAYRGRLVEEVGIERPESRLKLWIMETRALARLAASEGLEFLPPPAEAFDEQGFLAHEFYSDATHANASYGALVIDQICAILESSRAATTNG